MKKKTPAGAVRFDRKNRRDYWLSIYEKISIARIVMGVCEKLWRKYVENLHTPFLDLRT